MQYIFKAMKNLVMASVFLFFGFIGTVLAQSENPAQQNIWSFEDNPNPEYEELTEGELEFLYGEKSPEIAELYISQGACRIAILQNFKVYQKRYPEFGQAGNLEENFLNWKMHVSRRSGFMSCLTTAVWGKLSTEEFYYSFEDFVFCGIYSRPPVTSREIRLQKLIDELMEYARYGSEPPIFVLLALNEDSEFMNLNPDVEYYLSKLVFAPLADETPERDIHHLEAVLDEDRQEFIQQAARNYDLQSVLNNTAPCTAN